MSSAAQSPRERTLQSHVLDMDEKDPRTLGLAQGAFDDTTSEASSQGGSTATEDPLADKVALEDEPEPPKEQDPWDIVVGADNSPSWAELTLVGKLWRVTWIVLRLCMVVALLYCFVCSLDVLQDAFQLLGGRQAGNLFSNSVLINNPVCGLMVGVLVTVLVQSSSTSTSIVVSLVGAGILDVRPAIPIVMGANIGTTVTNTIVALTQSMDRDTFRRAWAGATVHDAFNWLTVLILLPIEVASGYLYHMTHAMVQGITPNEDSDNPQFLKVITVPLTRLIIQVDKSVITAIAQNAEKQKFPLAKYYCKAVTGNFRVEGANNTVFNEINKRMFTTNVSLTNETGILTYTEILDLNSTKCEYLFVGTGLPGNLPEKAAGVILFIGSLVALILCLLLMVKVLNSLLRGSMASIVRKTINADFPGRLSFLTGYVALLVGAGITVLVQSSSVFTSALTPLVGIGVVTIERVYPLTLGSNIGTTVTSMLAALTADPEMIEYTMQISLCHLFFNITGILIFYPIPFMRTIPIGIAKRLGNTTAKFRWFAVMYLIVMFLLLPLFVVGLSLAGRWVLVGVGVPLFVLLVVVIVINIVQEKRPHWLPLRLQNWDFLPLPLHSLEPYDKLVSGCTACCCCCSEKGLNCCCKSNKVEDSDASSQAIDMSPLPSSVGSQDDIRRSDDIETKPPSSDAHGRDNAAFSSEA